MTRKDVSNSDQENPKPEMEPTDPTGSAGSSARVGVLIEYGPLVAFFVTWLFSKDLVFATISMVGILCPAILLALVLRQALPRIPMIAAPLLLLFAGLTVFFDDPVWIKLRPTVTSSVFGLIMLIGVGIGRDPFGFLLGRFVRINGSASRKLGLRYGIFFFVLAAVNELVWRTQPDDMWVYYKVWGVPALSFVFSMFQMPLILAGQQARETSQEGLGS